MRIIFIFVASHLFPLQATEFAREVDFDNDGQIYYPEVADYLTQDG